MRKIVGLALITSIAASAPAQSQSLLNEILKKALSKPTARLAPRVIQSTSLANISSTQAMQIDKLTYASMQNSQIMADRSEALPLITAILKTGACAQNGAAWLGLNRQHMFPSSSYYSFHSPMSEMRYHDQSTCLDLMRLTDWSKPANNSLSFRAYYVSSGSGEARNQAYNLQKTTEGEWLIREIGHRN